MSGTMMATAAGCGIRVRHLYVWPSVMPALFKNARVFDSDQSSIGLIKNEDESLTSTMAQKTLLIGVGHQTPQQRIFA